MVSSEVSSSASDASCSSLESPWVRSKISIVANPVGVTSLTRLTPAVDERPPVWAELPVDAEVWPSFVVTVADPFAS